MAQSTPKQGKAAPPAEALSPQERLNRLDPSLRPRTQARLWLIAPNTPVAAKFRSGDFEMPYVLSPWTGEGEELHLLRSGTDFVFKKEGLGWRFASSLPLPSPPGIAPTGDAEKELREIDKDQAQPRVMSRDKSASGFQVDDKGTLYWIDRKAIFRWAEGKWHLLWNFPKYLVDRRGERSGSGYIVVLPKNRIALVGTTDAFLKILEFPDIAPPMETVDGAAPSVNPISKATSAPEEPKVLHSIGYDSIRACEKTLGPPLNVQFYAAGDHLFFYLGYIGRFFRLRLDSFSLTELDTPWIAEMAGDSPGMQSGWRPARENAPMYPVLPKAVAFAPRPDGTVHGRALMYNMDPAVIYSFDLGSEGSSIKAEINLESEMPEPIVLPDSKGDLVPIKNFIKPDPQPRQADSQKITNIQKITEPVPAQPSTLAKEN